MQETNSCDRGTEAQNILASVAATHPGLRGRTITTVSRKQTVSGGCVIRVICWRADRSSGSGVLGVIAWSHTSHHFPGRLLELFHLLRPYYTDRPHVLTSRARRVSPAHPRQKEATVVCTARYVKA